jgi:iron(III) transport system substrate-binding protein
VPDRQLKLKALTARDAAPRARFTLAGLIVVLLLPASAGAQSVNLYTTREPGLVRPLLEAFSAKTRIKVNTVHVKAGLAERVAAEGARSPADMLMTVDFGNLVELVDKGVTQPVRSASLDAFIPKHLRDPNGHWYALSLRARVVYASNKLDTLKDVTYENLADPIWKQKVCIRSGQHPYNTALIAAFIARNGETKTEAWLRGLKANLARKASGGDREVARDILAGICEIGVGNSYYVGLMRSGKGGPDQLKWGAAIKVLLARFEGGGTHVNASGAAIAKNSPNKANAVRLLEFLVTDQAQEIYARGNFEYPVRSTAKVDPIIAKLGNLVPDATPLTDIARNRKAASLLVDKVGLDY